MQPEDVVKVYGTAVGVVVNCKCGSGEVNPGPLEVQHEL